MTKIIPLAEAVGNLIKDGSAVAMEGFTHLIPHAAGHEVIRQNKKDLTLYRMTPDAIYDQLIGAGAVAKLVFSWGGNPGVGSLHRLRDAVENGWPRPLEIVEHTHAAMAAAYVAGASDMPFGIIQGVAGIDLHEHNDSVRWIESPFDGSRVLAVAAHRPDVTVIHAQRADRAGNVQLWGIVGIQKEAAMAAKDLIVTVEEIVDRIESVPGEVVLPHHVVTAVCHAPGGAHPSYAQDYTRRDNRFYAAWDGLSRDRDRFGKWIERHVRGTTSISEVLDSIANAGDGE